MSSRPPETSTADIVARLQSLSSGRQALFHRLTETARRRGVIDPDGGIPRRSSGGPAPLSFAQRRLWFLNQLAPESPFYDEFGVVAFKAVMNPILLQQALNEIVRRHEALRTVFRAVNGEPMQIVLPALALPLHFRDLRFLPASEREREALHIANADVRHQFDLETGPLVRFSLLQLGTEDHVFFVGMHHIVCDGWSMDVFFRELRALYGALVTRQPPVLPELPIQYADFAVWQRQLLSDETLESLLSYWKSQLRDLPTLDLPTDYPRPAVQSFRGDILHVSIDPALTKRIIRQARSEGTTLFVFLLTVFKVLLYRHTGSTDIVVGAPVSGRNHRETESLIGFFVNSLVLRVDLHGDSSFRESLQRVRKVMLDALMHQDLPFEVLVEHLQPQRTLSRNPLFQIAFQFVTAPERASVTGALTPLASSAKTARGTAIFDLALTLWEASEGLEGELEYSTELFKPNRMERMLRHFEVLLEGIVSDPDRRISDLPILPDEERERLFFEWNQTQCPAPELRCVHMLVEAQAKNRPDAVAVTAGQDGFNYAELNSRANRLAWELKRQGVGPETLVAICLERGLDMVTAILGIFKAGGAYLPLDPTYPAARLNYMLDDAAAALVVTNRSCQQFVTEFARQNLCLDEEPWTSEAGTENPPPNVGLENLAYVIYTSGSSGRPKGVEITHGGLANLVQWHLRQYQVEPSDRATQVASFAYDAAVWEIWPYLAAGGSVHVVDDLTRLSAETLLTWMAAHEITFSFLPTPLAEVVLKVPYPNGMRLKALLTGGDVLHERPHASLPCPLVNHYGPTENSVVTTFTRVSCSSDLEGPPTIGHPISNNYVYVLDAALNPVPIGASGQLFIGGAGLARGYRRRPELTNEKFIPNPFPTGGDRLYATGDLARYRDDGQLEFLGRLDQQIKIRGFRVELGEIESELLRHPDVQEAVVVADETQAGENRLAAYIVPRFGYSPANDTDLYEIWERDQVDRWKRLYDETYQTPVDDSDSDFNIIGWNSSYTGRPIPAAEMREWRDEAVMRISELSPKNILEIGCGTGLLLLQLAPKCQRYVATDFSRQAIQYTTREVRKLTLNGCDLRLLEREAIDLTGIEPAGFDTVILNSVVQYFPSVAYLLRVIEGALPTLQSGGQIFIGDVRFLPLLAPFQALIETDRAPEELPCDQLKHAIGHRLAQESELLIDPLFFLALREKFPRVSDVEIHLKHNASDNELTQFRYDVILQLDRKQIDSDEPDEIDWRGNRLTIDGLRQLLAKTEPAQLMIRRIPNARVTKAVALWDRLNGGGERTVCDLKQAVSQMTSDAVLPKDCLDVANERGYSAAIGWNVRSCDGAFDLFLRRRLGNATQPRLPFIVRDAGPLLALGRYGNKPLQGLLNRHLVPRLRQHLLGRLPEYMVPTSLTILELLPLTRNGKVDRGALPSSNFALGAGFSRYVAPRNAVEEVLCTIWAEVLGLERVSVRDNFFAELGGHSLLATQVLTRVNDSFRTELPLRLIFEAPTIGQFAETMLAQDAASDLKRTAELLISVDQMPPDQVAALISNGSGSALEKTYESNRVE